jgi:hypothetical protein
MFLSRSIFNLKDIILGKDLKAMLISKKLISSKAEIKTTDKKVRKEGKKERFLFYRLPHQRTNGKRPFFFFGLDGLFH